MALTVHLRRDWKQSSPPLLLSATGDCGTMDVQAAAEMTPWLNAEVISAWLLWSPFLDFPVNFSFAGSPALACFVSVRKPGHISGLPSFWLVLYLRGLA